MTVAYKTLGRNIRAARKACRLTQEQAAEKLGISLLHYGRLERGERRASLDHLTKISSFTDVSVYTLLKGCFPDDPSYSPSDPDARIKQIEAYFSSCSPHDQQIILEVCRAISHLDETGGA